MALSKKKVLIAASIAGLMTMTASGTPAAHAADSVPCYGVNACKGTGDCGGKGYSCHGHNACKGKGFVNLPADTCTRINGGTLQAAS